MEEEKNKKIDLVLLYVEDDIFTGETVETMLKRRIKNVFWAKNGKEGLEKFKEINPDVVVTDGTMPEMSGMEMTQKIREINKEVPIICTTAHEEDNFLTEARKNGITDYLLKPITKDKIRDAIAKFFPDKM